MKMVGGGQFANVVIENLIKAGVQNAIKNGKLGVKATPSPSGFRSALRQRRSRGSVGA